MMRLSVLTLAVLIGCSANPAPDNGMPDAGRFASHAPVAKLSPLIQPKMAVVRSSPMTTPDTYACRSGTSGIKNCGSPLQAPLGGLGYAADATVPSDGQGQVYDSMSGAYKLKTIVTSPITGTITANQGTGAGAAGPWSCELSDGSAFYTSAKTSQFPSALVGGRLDVNVGSAALPTGAATAAKQPAIGTAGTASADVLSIQGVAGGTPIPVSGTVTITPSGTQTVSGTVAVSSVSGNVATTNAANSQADGHSVDIGTLADAASANTLIGLLKAVKAAVQGTLAVSGTFWQATQPVSAASWPLPTGAAADSSVNGLLLAQASTTSGQRGPLCQAATTTSAPTYITGQTNPLSQTTGGGLRVDSSSWIGSIAPTVGSKASTSSIPVVIANDQIAYPVNVYGGAAVGAVPSGNPVPAAGTDGTNVRIIATDGSGRIKKAGYTYYHITGAGTGVVVKSGAGVLHSVTFGYGAALSTITLYDNTSASNVMSGMSNLAGSTANTQVVDWAFGTGLTYTSSGATEDITLAYE